jgi:hypothetical protein
MSRCVRWAAGSHRRWRSHRGEAAAQARADYRFLFNDAHRRKVSRASLSRSSGGRSAFCR